MGKQGGKMVGFMFGNVNKSGRLDEEYLEEDAKENLDALDGRIDNLPDDDDDDDDAPGPSPASRSRAGVAPPPFQAGPTAVARRAAVDDLDEDEDYDAEDDDEAPTQSSVPPPTQTTQATEATPEKPKKRKKVSMELSVPTGVEEDDLVELTRVDEASMAEALREQEMSKNDPTTPRFQEEAFETIMENAGATPYEHEAGNSTFSRFRPGVPLVEAFREKEEAASLNDPADYASFSFQPALNENWERHIQWDAADHLDPASASAATLDPSHDASHDASPLVPLGRPRADVDRWEDRILWDSEDETIRGPACVVCLDPEDPSVILERVTDTAKAAAEAAGSSGRARANLDWYKLSNDAYYSDQKKVDRNASKSKHYLDQKARHSAPALKMLTLRLTETMTKQELRSLHRPRGAFIPPKKRLDTKKQIPALKFGGSYQVNARVKSLVGYNFLIPNPFVANATTVDELWMTAKQLQPKLQRAFKAERPKLMVSAAKKMKPLKSQSNLGEIGENCLNLKGDVTFWMVTSKVSLILNANYRSFQEPRRPPGAFKSVRDLSIRDGHLFLFEYVEEHPLLLSNQGMGMRLLSFYRKQDKRDEAWKHLRVPQVASPENGSWGKYGRVIPLDDSDDPPFLGDVQKGQHMLGVDCNLFRAPAFYHPVQSTDFLLIRSSLGRWMVREITSTLVVGQQEPRVKTPWPGSVQIRDFEEKRFQDYVFRSLKKKLKDQAGGSHTLPELQVQELKHLFPNNSEQLIRNRLRGICNCVPVNQAQADGRWTLKPGARIPEEIELRHRLTPEMVCAYESMRASQERYAAMGMKRHELLRVSNERLKLATELLPGGEESKAAARFIEQMIQIASWAMTSNFMDVTKENRGAFNITGLGDPSGRGRAISFVKAQGRGAFGEVSKKPTTIAGTKTDLRRLDMGKAAHILKTLGVPDEEIKLLTRWNRINLIQRLSTAAAADGSKLGDKYGGFARTNRQSAAESQRFYQSKCQDVFNKQVLALTETEAVAEDAAMADGGGKGEGEEEAGDLANELENMLEDEEEDEEDKGKTEAELLAEDREEMRRLKEEGLFGEKKKAKDGAPTSAKGKAAKQDKPAHPKLRLRRIFKFAKEDGTMETKEVIITDPHQIETLRQARANYGGFGEGGGMINLTKERKKLQDRSLKLKKRIKKQKKQLELMGTPAPDQGPSTSGRGGTKLKLKVKPV